MLSFKKVSKSFGNISALNDLNFDIDKGEFVFVTGPSGAGKTTLLKLILREYLPDSGEINLDGTDITKLPNKDIPYLRRNIGVVFQDFKVLNDRTLRENVEVALAVIGMKEGSWNARVDDILKLVGLSERQDLFPNQLSGGELQRLSMARAIVVNPKILLADEPTGNLDWDTAERIMKLFEEINKEGKTVIMATHNKVLLKETKRRVIEIDAGKMVKDTGLKNKVREDSSKEKPEEAKEKVKAKTKS